MRLVISKAVEFLKKEDGPTAVEYAVMLASIIVECIAGITTLGSNANSSFANTSLKTAIALPAAREEKTAIAIRSTCVPQPRFNSFKEI